MKTAVLARGAALAAALCALPALAVAQSTSYVATRAEVAEELLRIVIDGNPDFLKFGINPAELRREPIVQQYAWSILQNNRVSGRQFTSDITVGGIYSLAGQLKHDICANVETPNYMDRYVRYQPTLAGWLTSVQNCLEAFGDAALASNGHVLARMIRGTDENLQVTPNSYGYTFYSGDSKYEFRTLAEASRRFIGSAPARSVGLAIFYGHGAPGEMTIGADSLTADTVVSALSGKMASGGELHLVGCNTSSVPMFVTLDPALPARGLSYFTRRLVYYTGLRASGADRETAGEMWNMDLARDVSLGLPGVKVCGMRTFGLVPARLVGHERVEPGLVLGERACYRDGAVQRE